MIDFVEREQIKMGYEENQAENKRNNTKTREIMSVFNVTRKIVGNKTFMDGQPRAYLQEPDSLRCFRLLLCLLGRMYYYSLVGYDITCFFS